MPRSFLVKKSTAAALCQTHSRDSRARKSSSSKSEGSHDDELPWEPMDMSEYEHGIETAHNVEKDLKRCAPEPVEPVKPVSPVIRDLERPGLRLPDYVHESMRQYTQAFEEELRKSDERIEDSERELHGKPFECRPSERELHGKPFECRPSERELHGKPLVCRPSERELHGKPFECRPSILSFKRPSEAPRYSLIYAQSSEAQTNEERSRDNDHTDRPGHSLIHSNTKSFKYYTQDCEGRMVEDRCPETVDKNPDKPYKCSECMMSYARPSDLQRHMLVHNNVKPFKSYPPVCRKEENSEEEQEDVDKTNDKPAEKPFKCTQCVMSFTRPSDLQRHLLIHNNSKPYKCEECDREFTWFGNFQKHILSHMNSSSPDAVSFSAMFTLLAREQVKDLFIKEGDKYKCRLCSKDFTRLSGLKTHIRMHTGERPYVCEVCSFAFTTSRALKMHMRLHTGEKPYKCDVCDRAFTRRDEMHTHMYIHKGEKPFKCTQCPASFIRYGHLQRHLLIHSDDKPYKCKLCPKSFTQYRNLQTHMYKHTGERPYRCKFCPKGFTQYGTLQAHERTHTGEKPFQCTLCDKAFITSSHLRWHVKTQHSTD